MKTLKKLISATVAITKVNLRVIVRQVLITNN